MARHTTPQREFIVRKLAAFYPIKDICAAFVAQFPDTACSETDVLANDPNATLLPPDLDALFRTERSRVMTDPSLDPFTEQKARLILLSRQVEYYSRNNQLAEARAVLRQIAEETGVVAGKGAAKTPAKDDEDKTPQFKSVKLVREVVDPLESKPSA